MSVNVPERDLDPEELELEQEEAFGMYQPDIPSGLVLISRFLITSFFDADINIDLDCEWLFVTLFSRGVRGDTLLTR